MILKTFNVNSFCNYYLVLLSGVATRVAGVAEATPIFQFLFNRFGQKIWVKKILLTAGYTNLKNLPTSLVLLMTNALESKHAINSRHLFGFLIQQLVIEKELLHSDIGTLFQMKNS